MSNGITKLLVNTDIIIDLLYKHEPYYLQCLELIKVAEERHIKLYVSAFSLHEIISVLEQHLDPTDVGQAMRHILSIFEVYGLTQTDIKNALLLHTDRLEPALLKVTALRLKTRYIVSNRFSQRTEEFITIPRLLGELAGQEP